MSAIDPSKQAGPRKRKSKRNKSAARPNAAAQQGRPSQRRRRANTGKKRRDKRPARDQHRDRNPQRIPYERGVKGDYLLFVMQCDWSPMQHQLARQDWAALGVIAQRLHAQPLQSQGFTLCVVAAGC